MIEKQLWKPTLFGQNILKLFWLCGINTYFTVYKSMAPRVRKEWGLRHVTYAYVHAQSCTLCNPVDCSPPGSSVHGTFQARIVERVVIFFSRGSSWPTDWNCISCTGRWILYHSAIREVHGWVYLTSLSLT